jgi:GT2 family glycosyltransferase
VKLSVVVLTMGNRPAELKRAVDSALAQKGVDVEVVLVGNGADVPGSWPPAVHVLHLPENVGIPAGRNRGVEASTGDLILFLDDDGWYESTDLGRHLVEEFTADPKLGIVSFRVRDPEGGPGERRHVPRLRAGDPLRSSEVTTFLGGACAMRRAAFDAAGGLPEDFFYAHEETDLASASLAVSVSGPVRPGRRSPGSGGSASRPRR